jgi:hypothetical protein
MDPLPGLTLRKPTPLKPSLSCNGRRGLTLPRPALLSCRRQHQRRFCQRMSRRNLPRQKADPITASESGRRQM